MSGSRPPETYGARRAGGPATVAGNRRGSGKPTSGAGGGGRSGTNEKASITVRIATGERIGWSWSPPRTSSGCAAGLIRAFDVGRRGIAGSAEPGAFGTLLFTRGLPDANTLEETHIRSWEGAAMNFEGKAGRKVHGSEQERGQEVHVRAGEVELGIGIVDEVTSGGGNAVWIFFPGAAPRRLPTDHGSIEFTVLESDPGPRITDIVSTEMLRRN